MSKLLLIDADTIIYSSAAKEEINKCLATNKNNGKSQMFPSKSAFNEWHKEYSKYPKEDYEFEVVKELVGETSYACSSVKKKIATILEAVQHNEFKICIQGSNNYRMEYPAKYVAYKQQRGEKPLLFKETYQYVIDKWGKNVVVVDNEEVDDYACYNSWKHWNPRGNVEDSKIVVAFCDKDIHQHSVGALFNYMKPDGGVFWNTRKMQYSGYWKSCLTGDQADNIDGILKLAEETKKKYGIKTSTCGPVAAAKILCEVVSERDAAQRVVDAYNLAWPEDGIDRLRDMAFFLWLRKREGQMYNLREHLDFLGVSY